MLRHRPFYVVVALILVLFGVPAFGQDKPFSPTPGDLAPVTSPTHDAKPYPSIGRGDFGPAVFNLQKMLVMVAEDAHGSNSKDSDYYPGIPDGDFGPRTEKAVIFFQMSEGFERATGRMDALTWRKLIERVDFIEDSRFNPDIRPDDSDESEDLSPYSSPEDIKALSERIGTLLVGRRESEAEAIISLINELLKNTGSSTRIQLFVSSNDAQDFPCQDDLRVDRIKIDIRRGAISSVRVE